jgi:hypothetical protein
VRCFTVATECQLIDWSTTFTTGSLGDIDVTKQPFFEVVRFGTTTRINTTPKAVQHALVEMASQFQEGWFVF